MSFNIIRKKTYYDLLGEYNKKYNIIRDKEITGKIISKCKSFSDYYGITYAVFDTGEVISWYLSMSDLVILVNEKYDVDLIKNKLLTEDLIFDIWKLTKLSTQTPYTCNEYLRYCYWENTKEDEGEYLLENTYQDKETISIKLIKEDWGYTRAGMCYERKLSPNASSEINEICKEINLLEILFNECRKRNS